MTTRSGSTAPPWADGRHVLLFVDREHPDADDAERRFCSAMAEESGARVVDLSTDDETARWFGINEGPVVAVVCDGVLLALEHGCSDEACARVRDLATQRDPRAFEGLLLPRPG